MSYTLTAGRQTSITEKIPVTTKQASITAVAAAVAIVFASFIGGSNPATNPGAGSNTANTPQTIRVAELTSANGKATGSSTQPSVNSASTQVARSTYTPWYTDSLPAPAAPIATPAAQPITTSPAVTEPLPVVPETDAPVIPVPEVPVVTVPPVTEPGPEPEPVPVPTAPLVTISEIEVGIGDETLLKVPEISL